MDVLGCSLSEPIIMRILMFQTLRNFFSNFDMLHAIKGFALLGGEWVLYILLALSVLSVMVILNRLFFFWDRSKGADLLDEELSELLVKGKLSQAKKLLESTQCPEGMVLKAGLSSLS